MGNRGRPQRHPCPHAGIIATAAVSLVLLETVDRHLLLIAEDVAYPSALNTYARRRGYRLESDLPQIGDAIAVSVAWLGVVAVIVERLAVKGPLLCAIGAGDD